MGVQKTLIRLGFTYREAGVDDEDESGFSGSAMRVAGNLLRASATDREAALYAIGFACALEAMHVQGDDCMFVINDRVAKGDTVLQRGMMHTGKLLREARDNGH